MNNIQTEQDFLRKEVARRFGRAVETSKDFEHLAQAIEESTGEEISTSTLKRIWGYMSLHPMPRVATLDILSRYVGRQDWNALLKEINDASAFISVESVRSIDLENGTKIRLKWLPDREVILRHVGSLRFEVEDSGSSKLRQGDTFEVMEFLKGHPLYIPGIIRAGERLPEYVAGRTAGLTSVEVL